MSDSQSLKNIVEAALLAAGRPLSLDALQALFGEIECPEKKDLRSALNELADDYDGRGIEVAEVASGWRIQVREACSPWVSRLWDERPARYSRALMETLALIAYRQPITRGEIEDIRGVSVSTNIVRTLMEREWVHVVGQRDVPGKPSLYGTTREFLDYFGLKSLDQLPTLAELRDLDEINRELDLNDPDKERAEVEEGPRAEGQEIRAEGLGPRAEEDERSDAEAIEDVSGDEGEVRTEGVSADDVEDPGPRTPAPGPAAERAEGRGPRAEEEERSYAGETEADTADEGEAHTESVSADDVEGLGPRPSTLGPGEPREP